MDTTYYLHRFQNALDSLDMEPFNQNGLELKVAVWHNSTVLKIQKPNWRNNSPTDIPFQNSIFFSIWVNDDLHQQNKLYYNIHALKLRKLSAYKLESRKFAEAFRLQFKAFQSQWPNVSTSFGPLTLMEGYIKIDTGELESAIANLAHSFVSIQFIIDDLLQERKIKR